MLVSISGTGFCKVTVPPIATISFPRQLLERKLGALMSAFKVSKVASLMKECLSQTSSYLSACADKGVTFSLVRVL